MDPYFPSGDPLSFSALYVTGPTTPALPSQRRGTDPDPAAARIPLTIVNGAGGLVSVLEFTERDGPDRVLPAAGWRRTEPWHNDSGGRRWARVEAIGAALTEVRRVARHPVT